MLELITSPLERAQLAILPVLQLVILPVLHIKARMRLEELTSKSPAVDDSAYINFPFCFCTNNIDLKSNPVPPATTTPMPKIPSSPMLACPRTNPPILPK